MTLEALRYALMGISAYRNIMDEPLMEEVSDLLDAVSGGRGGEALERYAAVFYRLRQEGYETLGGWLRDKLRYEDGPYPRLVERALSQVAPVYGGGLPEILDADRAARDAVLSAQGTQH